MKFIVTMWTEYDHDNEFRQVTVYDIASAHEIAVKFVDNKYLRQASIFNTESHERVIYGMFAGKLNKIRYK